MFGSIGSGRPAEEEPLQAVTAKTFAKPHQTSLMGTPETPQPYTSPFRISSMHSGGGRLSSGYSIGASRDLSSGSSYVQSSYGNSSGLSTTNSYGSMSSSHAATERHRDDNHAMHSFCYSNISHNNSAVQRDSIATVAKQGLEIEALQKEINRLSQKLSRQDPVSIHKMDNATENAFRDLNAKVKSKNDEVQRLEMTIESLLAQGAYDESAAYRVCSKMQSLVAENKRLGSMLGAGRALQQEIEIGILRVENETLQQQIDALNAEKKGKDLKHEG
ncbi:hypothetical protein B0I72DRAFT_7647 [Yarrowia lipolytica]|jgi:hypothetical protein|uniref:Protein MUM2 n=1 Tax=Yarrowia lipolytica TaxID=4952 RepID=A0A371C3A5_YARLL|nr:Hypothetical protein YALI2_C00479g [Yarrowia lipolytica]RDW24797.1 hypothetical protein B0I71DRAFT_121013 [Yarrowia lipolytica]RDW34870.1 hypothetical protein B0I72DRAFT_7647 [Yarrowia lipolytica]RDW40831.1 hypothetical protein B0I73DRAFT_152237 [Yarrowia lipolytica]RDW44595.1 hypothetical protein B0I74DRAFT_115365 [Yarrowia lipolytica]